jgi:hypothetical protein
MGHASDLKCVICGDIAEGRHYFALGHDDSGEPVEENYVEATCAKDGSYDLVVYCARTGCGEELSRETVTIKKTNSHTWERTERVTKEATCVEQGEYVYETKCTVCDLMDESGSGFDFIAINPDNHAEINGCQCEACGDEWHIYKPNNDAVEPTCVQDGKTASKTCTTCQATVAGETIPATGQHTPGEASLEQSLEYPDLMCTYDKVVRCTVCNEELSRTTVEEHSFDDDMTPCTCSNCGNDFHDCSIWPCTCEREGCGYTNHKYNSDSICEYCSFECDQDHSVCVCSECGHTNHSFVDGECEICQTACTYRDNGAGQCAECGGTPDQHKDADACLIASTPILMADGTEKAISEVQAGDMIKSWDLDNNEYVDVKVLGSYRTGDATDWLVYSFDNGKELTIYDQHNIYCKENKSIKKSTYWKPDQTAITLDGNETAYCGVVDSETPEKVSRHTLVTENNLYFANGILCGHHARAKYKFFTKDMLEASLEQASQFKETFDIYQAMNGTENAEYRKEAAELIKTIREAKAVVKDRNSKFAKDSGKLHKKQTNKKLKEIKQFNSEADTFKVDIKTINKDIRKSRKELNKLKEKYGVSTKTIYECWKEAYDLDMKYLKEKAAE